MAIYDDFSIDYVNKRIYHNSGATIYSVNALYSYLQDTFDELGQLDDPVPMSAQTPTAYTMINGWFIDNDTTQYLNGGAITTSGWSNEIHVINFGGTYTNCVTGDIGKAVTDDGGAFGTLLAYDNTLKRWWVRTGSATTAASGSTMVITTGTGTGVSSATSTTGEHLWANIYSLGSIEAGTNIYVEQNGSKLTSWWSSGHIDILVLVKVGGVEIDGANVTVLAREYGNSYDYFSIDLTSGGRQAIPLATAVDLNNTTSTSTIEDYQDGTTANIAITFGSYTADINNDSTLENYVVRIDCNGQRLDKVYEVMKYWTRRGSSTTLNSIIGDLYKVANGSYTAVKASPLGTFAGGKLFAARGVYLINLHPSDIQSYQLTDADGNIVTPPNYVSVTVSGVVAGDRVAVFPASGGTVNKAQYTSHNTSNSQYDTDFVLTASLPADTPASGSLIVYDTSAKQEHIYRYTSFSGSTLTFPSGLTRTATGGDTVTLIDSGATFLSANIQYGDLVYDSTNADYAYVVSVDSDIQLTTTKKATSWSGSGYRTHQLIVAYNNTDTAYIPYLYTLADATSEYNTIVYVSDRSVLTRVRKAGILPFEVAGTISSSGLSVTAIRTTDTIIS
jgi:hypothetical protein